MSNFELFFNFKIESLKFESHFWKKMSISDKCKFHLDQV